MSSHLHIGNQWIHQNLFYAELFPRLSDALVLYTLKSSSINQPLRQNMPLAHVNGYLRCMPSFVGSGDGALAVKLLTDFSTNVTRPQIQGCIVLFDTAEGHVLATLDAEEITGIRTAAVSALAYRAVQQIRQSPDFTPSVLTIVGTGVQCRYHVDAFWALGFPWKEIRIVSRSYDRAVQTCKALAEDRKNISANNLRAFQDVNSAIQGADAIVLVTSSSSPVLDCSPELISAHSVIISVGACRPDHREIGDALLARGSIWVDCKRAASTESGDIVQSSANVDGEIGELLFTALEKPNSIGRLQQPTFIPIIKTLGLAMEDATTAKLMFDKYVEKHKIDP